MLRSDTSYGAMVVQLGAIGGGLGLLAPPLTSAMLGSVEKQKSGIAAGVLNATRQSGSVIGLALHQPSDLLTHLAIPTAAML